MAKLNKDFDIELGNQRDVCFYCLQEYHKEHPNTDPVNMRKELGGKLLNKEVYKNRKIGRDFVICRHHIRKIAEAMDLEVTEKEQKELEAIDNENDNE